MFKNATAFAIFLLTMLFFYNPSSIIGQGQIDSVSKETETTYTKEALSQVLARLEQPSDTTLNVVLEMVRHHCGDDFTCQYDLYDAAQREIQLGNKYWQGLLIAEEMFKIAEEHGDLERQARAIKHQADLYGFLEDRRAFQQKYQDLLKIYEQMGDHVALLETKAFLAEGRIWSLGEVEKGIEELEELLAEANRKNLREVEIAISIRLKYAYEENGLYDKLVKTIEFLEDVIEENSKPFDESSKAAFHVAAGRADLLLMEKQYEEALAYYQKARNIISPRHRTFHDTWLDIYTLLRMANLEWERNRSRQAQEYLDTAAVLAVEGKMHERMLHILDKKIEIAEIENRYKDALEYTREKYYQQFVIDSLAKGFDHEQYQLELIKERLETENEKQALEIRFKNSQLLSSVVIAILSLLILIGLFVSRRKLQRDKKALASQNSIIEQQKKDLEQVNKVKDDFFANISHELRTPLTVILGVVQLEKVYPYYKQIIQRNAKRLLHLVNELLDLSKLDAGNLTATYQRIDLVAYLRFLLPPFQVLAVQKDIELSFTTEKESCMFVSDAEKLRQIISNLLSNAIKFTPYQGKIQLSLLERQRSITLIVEDDGIGIPDDALANIFDRFYQVEKSDNTPVQGTGIGLALVKELVHLLEGTIQVESEFGKGTTFTIHLPQSSVKDAPLLEHFYPSMVSLGFDISTPAVATNTNKELPIVLIIEDDPDIVIFLQALLQFQYQVQVAKDGETGISHAIEQIPDIIICDVQMPKKNGFEVVEVLKTDKRSNHIPIIMLTARVTQKDKLTGLKHGADAYLTKPFDQEELFIRLEKLLELRHLLQKRYATLPTTAEEQQKVAEAEPEFIQKIRTILEKDIQQTQSVEQIAEKMFLTRVQVYRKVKALIGLTPSQLINRIRLEHGAKLLHSTSLSIAEIAYDIGYKDPNYFSRLFAKMYGKSPSNYRVALANSKNPSVKS